MKRYFDRWPLNDEDRAEIDGLAFGRDWSKLLINGTDILGGDGIDGPHLRIAVTRGMDARLVAELQESDVDGVDGFSGWVRFSSETEGYSTEHKCREGVYVEAPLFFGQSCADLVDGFAYFRVLAWSEYERWVRKMREGAKTTWHEDHEDDSGTWGKASLSTDRLCPVCASQHDASWPVGGEAESETGRCALCGMFGYLFLPEHFFGLDPDFVKRERPVRHHLDNVESEEPADQDLAAILDLDPWSVFTKIVVDPHEIDASISPDEHHLSVRLYAERQGTEGWTIRLDLLEDVNWSPWGEPSFWAVNAEEVKQFLGEIATLLPKVRADVQASLVEGAVRRVAA